MSIALVYWIICFFIVCVCVVVYRTRMKSYLPLPQALAALQSDAAVTCSRQRLPGAFWKPFCYLFTPAGAQPTKAFVFYPGGLVDPRSYAPLARAIAAQGFAVALVSMPLDLALLGRRRADMVMQDQLDITKWAVGGHSLGGVAACSFAGANTDRVAGVVLWASYPSNTFRLDTTHLPVVSIYGTHDGLTTLKKIENSHQHLPDGSGFVAIEGGNHSQFCLIKAKGDLYRGDNAATISREEQQNRIVAATVAFLEEL